MKNKMKKVTAMMLMSVMLLGGVMTVHAASDRNCYDHTGEPRNQVYSVASASTHIVNGQVCTVKKLQVTYDAYCSKCELYLGTHTAPAGETHSIQH